MITVLLNKILGDEKIIVKGYSIMCNPLDVGEITSAFGRDCDTREAG